MLNNLAGGDTAEKTDEITKHMVADTEGSALEKLIEEHSKGVPKENVNFHFTIEYETLELPTYEDLLVESVPTEYEHELESFEEHVKGQDELGMVKEGAHIIPERSTGDSEELEIPKADSEVASEHDESGLQWYDDSEPTNDSDEFETLDEMTDEQDQSELADYEFTFGYDELVLGLSSHEDLLEGSEPTEEHNESDLLSLEGITAHHVTIMRLYILANVLLFSMVTYYPLATIFPEITKHKWTYTLLSVSSLLVIQLFLPGIPEHKCSSNNFTPMVPLIAYVYTPLLKLGKTTLNKIGLFKEMFLLNIFNRPLPRPLFPTVDKNLTESALYYRIVFFIPNMLMVTLLIIIVLESGRELSQRRQPNPAPFELCGQRQRNILFCVFYVLYEVMLYVWTDVFVANGFMSPTTGLDWEAWAFLLSCDLLTHTGTGIIRYIFYRGRRHQLPTILVLSCYIPFVGNHIHIWKDHVSQGIFFSAAHCHTGVLQYVGQILGCLGFVATIVPLAIPQGLLRSSKCQRVLQRAHVPILESRQGEKVDGSRMCDLCQKFDLWENLMSLMIFLCTEEKKVKVIWGETPYAILHMLFIFFFGGSPFIYASLSLTLIKRALFYRVRSFVRNNIYLWTCSLDAAERYLASDIAEDLRSFEKMFQLGKEQGWDDHFKDKTLQAYVDFVKENPDIDTFDWNKKGIGLEGAKAIGECLDANQKLVELKLYNNQFNGEAAKEIAKGIARNKSLKIVDMDDNEIGDDGAQALAEAIGANRNLVRVTVRRNSIHEEARKALEDAWHPRDPDKMEI